MNSLAPCDLHLSVVPGPLSLREFYINELSICDDEGLSFITDASGGMLSKLGLAGVPVSGESYSIINLLHSSGTKHADRHTLTHLTSKQLTCLMQSCKASPISSLST